MSVVVVEVFELLVGWNKCLWFVMGIDYVEVICVEFEVYGEIVVVVYLKSVICDDDLVVFMIMGDNGVCYCVNFGVLIIGFDFDVFDCIVMFCLIKLFGLWV